MGHIRGSRRARTVAVFALVALGASSGLGLTPARAAILGDPHSPFVRPFLTTASSPRLLDAKRERSYHRARYLLVEVEGAMPITALPGGGGVLGMMPAGSRFYGTPTVAWVRDVSRNGRFGLVNVPYAGRSSAGWIPIRGLESSLTGVSVEADLSEHRITVRRGDRVLFIAPAATGAPGSPTPTGRYFVTDRVAFPGGGSLGTFAFGISGIQTNLPGGWAGGDQLAIHGTNVPSSIGRSASAGCLRVSELVLARLKPILRLGTPVIVHR